MTYYCSNLKDLIPSNHRPGSVIDCTHGGLYGDTYAVIVTSKDPRLVYCLKKELSHRKLSGFNLYIKHYITDKKYFIKFIENYSDCNLMSMLYPVPLW